MLRILLAVTALLIYGSLYPWQFHEGTKPGAPVDALLHSWQISFNRFIVRDIALNISIYIPFGAAAYLWLRSRAAAVRFAVPVLLAALLSIAIELAQFYDAHRCTSLVDVATNVTGAVFGMLLAIPIARRDSGDAVRIAQPGALLLVGCWVGAMLFPLIPDFSHTHLIQKLRELPSGGFSTVSFFAMFVAWLAAGRLMFAVVGAGSESIVFPLLGLVLPARFLVAGLTAGWTYWAAFGVAWFLWIASLTRARRRDFILAGLVLASVVLTGISPFHFSAAPQAFGWVPFRALFLTDWETGFPLFLSKVFLYGSAAWLLREAGIRLRYAALLTALILAAIEAAQIYLPNHVAEVTDPLMALLIAWILHRLARAVAHSDHVQPSRFIGSRTGQSSANAARFRS